MPVLLQYCVFDKYVVRSEFPMYQLLRFFNAHYDLACVLWLRALLCVLTTVFLCNLYHCEGEGGGRYQLTTRAVYTLPPARGLGV